MVDLHAFSSTYAFTCNKARYHLQTPHAGAVLYLSGTLQSIQLPLEKIFVSHARVGIHSKTGQLLQHPLQMFGDSRYAWSVAGNPKLRAVKCLLDSNRDHCLSSSLVITQPAQVIKKEIPSAIRLSCVSLGISMLWSRLF
jgi:hypothetical protein